MKCKYFVLLSVLIVLQSINAQTKLDALDADELFVRARDLAFSGQRDSARVILKIAIAKSPAYTDLKVLLARTYAWDGRRKEARQELKRVLKEKPKYLDALQAAIDVEMWDGKFPDALVLCNTALKYFPNDEELLVKRVKIYRDMDKDGEALFTLSILEDINRSNPEIQPLRESIKTRSYLNSIGVSYTHDWFNVARFSPRDQMTVQYTRITPIGSVALKLNGSRRFGNEGYQVELEAYPKIVSGIYAYANYGYSWTKNFPKHRFGLEPFFKLPESFEASIGTRLLFFSNSPIDIYTASVGYYLGDYWFSLRTYLIPGKQLSRSFSLTIRQYFGGDGTYAFLKGGAGSTPDEDNYTDTTGTRINLLKSQSIGTGFQYVIDLKSTVDFSVDYKYEEVIPGLLVNNYALSFGYKFKF
ncbi:MAG: YaiO family outer membrane beta-barrel protein [Bacteroidota bacterium]